MTSMLINSTIKPTVLARNMIHTVEHSTCGPIKLVNTPLKFAENGPTIRSPPPTLGQHTNEILTEMGFSMKHIDEMKASGMVA